MTSDGDAGVLGELSSVELRRSLRGYDVGDVDAFLEQVRIRVERMGSGPALQFDDDAGSERSDLIEGVRSVEFRLALRGYDVDQVDALLEQVARSLSEHP